MQQPQSKTAGGNTWQAAIRQACSAHWDAWAHAVCNHANASSSDLQFFVSLDPMLEGGAQAALQQQITDAGGHIASYLPDHTLRIVADAAALQAVSNMPGVRLRG